MNPVWVIRGAWVDGLQTGRKVRAVGRLQREVPWNDEAEPDQFSRESASIDLVGKGGPPIGR